MAVIRIRDLGYQVGKVLLLDRVSFDLAPGELLAVCGPNGAGKSTLLKCLAGQLRPSCGEILVGDKKLDGLPPAAVAKWRAVLPQSGAIPFDFSAEEIVRMGRAPHEGKTISRETRGIVEAAMRLSDAYHLRGRPVTTLSGGEMQRVHLARVLAQIWEPVEGFERLLLLDEPTSALDPRHQIDLLRVVRDWVERGVAALVILHDINLAARFATRIVLLKEGTLRADAPPCEVLAPGLLFHVFGIQSEVLVTSDGKRFLATLEPHQT